MRGVSFALALLATGALAVGCSSSGGTRSSAPPSLTSSSAPSSRPASSSSAPSTSAAPPLSPFEADPGVKAMRAWAAAAGQAVNSGHDDSAALAALMTPGFASTMPHVLGSDVGLRYPGPLPLQPIAVSTPSTTRRLIKVCGVNQGFAVSPKTGKPVHARTVIPVFADVRLVGGRWLMNNLSNTTVFSCAGVKVAEPTW